MRCDGSDSPTASWRTGGSLCSLCSSADSRAGASTRRGLRPVAAMAASDDSLHQLSRPIMSTAVWPPIEPAQLAREQAASQVGPVLASSGPLDCLDCLC